MLFEQVCRQLNLLEADYFGLEYHETTSNVKVKIYIYWISHGENCLTFLKLILCFKTFLQYWLDLEKPINRQVGLSLVEPMLKFCVKFYTPDPVQLEEEFTR